MAYSAFVCVLVVATTAMAMPYRSTQGVLRGRANLNDFLTTYLQSAQQRPQPQYGYLEYQPSYHQGYISHRPRRISNRPDPYVRYMRPADYQPDYPSYDYPSSDDETYTDNDGTWYDDSASSTTAIGSPSYVPQVPVSSDVQDNEPTDQDLALAQLMLDHIAGKYSLEDLETLEREARMEENSEHQLRALTKKVHRKKSMVMPFTNKAHSSSSRPSSSHGSGIPARLSAASRPSQNVMSVTQRRGQKEEPVMVPATSVRRPVFVQQLEQQQEKSKGAQREVIEKKSVADKAKTNSIASSTSYSSVTEKSSTVSKSSALNTPAGSPRTSGVVEVVKVSPKNVGPTQSSASKDGASSTMAPYVQSAYEALKHYLDTERQARMIADQEMFKTPEKRFVQEPDSLTRQLDALKKNVA